MLGYDWGRYAPDYTKCMEHFALHAGGYAVLKGIQKGMSLPMEMMLPSFASLRDMGNTSSSTTWYSMAYMERFGMVTTGQRIMQVTPRARRCGAATRRGALLVVCSAPLWGTPAGCPLLPRGAAARSRPPSPARARPPQVGAGGGMKGGVNVWRALRNTKDLHAAWMHIDRPYEEADLPRRINIEEKEPAAAAAGGRGAGAKGKGKGGKDEADAARLSGKAAHVPASSGKHRNAIQRAIEIEANHEADELGVVAL